MQLKSTTRRASSWRIQRFGFQRKKEIDVSVEERLRGRDSKISGCLALEFLRHEPALRAAYNMRTAYVDAEIGVYRLPCSLRTEDLA
jgi:hypothetical protein